jgi:hypothetical protein
MLSSGMLRHVALVIPDVSEERFASIIRVARIGELGTTLAVTSIPENDVYHSQRQENFKSYTATKTTDL